MGVQERAVAEVQKSEETVKKEGVGGQSRDRKPYVGKCALRRQICNRN
jgi:hypothetical protein